MISSSNCRGMAVWKVTELLTTRSHQTHKLFILKTVLIRYPEEGGKYINPFTGDALASKL